MDVNSHSYSTCGFVYKPEMQTPQSQSSIDWQGRDNLKKVWFMVGATALAKYEGCFYIGKIHLFFYFSKNVIYSFRLLKATENNIYLKHIATYKKL